MVARVIAINFPESVLAVHANMVPAALPSWWRQPLSLLRFFAWAVWTGRDKDGLLARLMWWRNEESGKLIVLSHFMMKILMGKGYYEIQGTKPQTISYALADSPLGMLAWLRDKMEPLVDDDFTWDDEIVITWAMLYLIPTSSAAPQIYTNVKGSKLADFESYLLSKKVPSNVDFGVSIFPKDVVNVPRFWAEACVADNIVFWKEHSKGGHFPSVERPEVLVEDIRSFTSVIGRERMGELRRCGKVKV
jgi:hypothetical protein